MMRAKTFVFRSSSVISSVTARRDLLRQLVKKQLNIAMDLTHTEGTTSRAARCAWDVVEELSRTLNKIENNLADMQMHPLKYRDSIDYDDELGIREYDI